MAFVSPPGIPVVEGLRTAFGPASAVGIGLCSAAAVGFARLALRLLLALPPELFIYAGVFLAGLALVLGEVLWHLWKLGVLQWMLARAFLWYMRLAQRLVLLGYMPSVSLQDLQVLFFEVLPHYAVAAILGTRSLGSALERMRAAKVPTGGGPAPEHTAAALEWLKRPRLALGYEEQVYLYGLARQASKGDCPAAQATAGPDEASRRRSWELRRGQDRSEAAGQLVRTLAALDPGFVRAHPSLVRELPPPPLPQAEIAGAEMVRLLCGLVETRLPEDLDERMHRGKRWLLVAAVFLSALAAGRGRLRRSSRWRHLMAAVGQRTGLLAAAVSCAYLAAITYGLPPSVHARLPRALRRLPEAAAVVAEEAVGGPAPRLCRRAAQALLPPVRGSLLRDF